MGTPAFAVPSLEALLDSRHRVVAVVTQPDRPAGRGRALTPPPVKEVAEARGIPFLQPKGVRGAAFLERVRSFEPDVLAVTAFGRILPPALLDLPPHGGVNVHASLLPKLRGAAPVAWAIARGESITGVTTMRMVEKLDAGEILLQRSTAIRPEETAGELEARLATMGASLLMDTLDALDEGSMAFLPQNEEEATFAPIIRKEDGRIDWSRPAPEIALLVRAFNPWPVAHTTRGGKGMRIWKARVGPLAEEGAGEPPPGFVLGVGPGGVRVACGGGSVLQLLEVQPEGRRRMSGAEAAAGRYFTPGDLLS